MTDEIPRCVRCGHSATYHGLTFCRYPTGAPPGRICDCEGWGDERLIEAATTLDTTTTTTPETDGDDTVLMAAPLAVADHEWSKSHGRTRCTQYPIPAIACSWEDHLPWAEDVLASLVPK